MQKAFRIQTGECPLAKLISWLSRTTLAIGLIAFIVWAANTTIRNVNIVNSTGAFTALSDSALSTGCVGNTGGTFNNSNCLSQVNLYLHIKTLAANVSQSATTPEIIDSYTLPALPALCGTNGCRLRVAYNYYVFGGTYGFCWISDGTSSWGQSYIPTDTNFSMCSSGASLSPSQYSSGATPSVYIYGIDAGTWTACTATAGASSPCTTAPANSPAVPSQLAVEDVPSN